MRRKIKGTQDDNHAQWSILHLSASGPHFGGDFGTTFVQSANRQFDLGDLNDEPVNGGAALLEQHRAGLHRLSRKHICQIGNPHDMPPPVAQPRTEKLLSSLISRLRE